MTPFGAFTQWVNPPNAIARPDPTLAAASTAPEAVTPQTMANTTPAAAVDVLREALRKANIEPSGLNLYYEEYAVGYPGGAYTSRYVTCELPNGLKESYDANLMLKNPWLTAFEVGRLMGFKS